MSEDSAFIPQDDSEGSTLRSQSILQAPYWPEPISVVTRLQSSFGFAMVKAVGLGNWHRYTSPRPWVVGASITYATFTV